MKTYFTFLLLLAAIGSSAQAIKIKSKSTLADSIWINRGALEVMPFLTGSDSTVVRSIDYNFSPQRDTSQSFTIQVRLYDKNAGYISSSFITAPGTLFLRWLQILNKIDNYILKKRLNKQN